MRTFDPEQTRTYFDHVYSTADMALVARDPEAALHHRDWLLIDSILPKASGVSRILDFGCGQGRLVTELVQRGYDAYGLEKHEGMQRVALDNLAAGGADRDRIALGGHEALAATESESLDMFVAMGVFQYVDDAEQDEILSHAHRLLKPGGHLCCTFQNAFFDLFTFNKYTIDFITNELLGPYATDDEKEKLTQGLADLVTNSAAPPYSPTRARDNVYVRLTNPLAIRGELADRGFALDEIYFYEFFGVPPLLTDRFPELAKRIAAWFERDNATRWEGNFMANALLVDATKS